MKNYTIKNECKELISDKMKDPDSMKFLKYTVDNNDP